MRASPGSSRSITSPSATRSHRRPVLSGTCNAINPRPTRAFAPCRAHLLGAPFIKAGLKGPPYNLKSTPQPTPVHREHVTVDVPRCRGCKEHHRTREIVRLSPASCRNALENLAAPHRIVAQRLRVVGFHVSR